MTPLLAVAARWALQMQPHGPVGPHGGHGSGVMPWGGAGGVGFIWPLLVLVAAVVLGSYLVLSFRRDWGRDEALAVLRRRYARGEIDGEEFEERASRLSTESAE